MLYYHYSKKDVCLCNKCMTLKKILYKKKTPKQKKYNKWNPGSLDFDIKGSTTEQKKLGEELGYILS